MAHNGPEKVFKMEVLAWLESAILRLIFAYIVFHKRTLLQILYAEYIGIIGQARSSFHLSVLESVSYSDECRREKSFSVCEEMLPLFRAVL